MTTKALKANLAVVKSPNKKLPAQMPKRAYGEFDEFLDLGDKIGKQYDSLLGGYAGLCGLLEEAESRQDWTPAVMERALAFHDDPHTDGLKAQIAAFDAACEHYNGGALYTCEDENGRRKLRRRAVAEQIGLLIGSFPNAVPHNPEAYTGMLIEEVIASGASAVALEATCRIIRRTQKFPPAISEVLEILQEQDTRWSNMLDSTNAREIERLSRSAREKQAEIRKLIEQKKAQDAATPA